MSRSTNNSFITENYHISRDNFSSGPIYRKPLKKGFDSWLTTATASYFEICRDIILTDNILYTLIVMTQISDILFREMIFREKKWFYMLSAYIILPSSHIIESVSETVLFH